MDTEAADTKAPDLLELDSQTDNTVHATASDRNLLNDDGSDGKSETNENTDDELDDNENDSEQGDDDDASSDCGSEDSWEGEPPPLEINYEALKHIANLFLPGSHGECVDTTTTRRGTYHEARVLHFEDGWSCIGRFTREPALELLEKTESELATMAYVRSHTNIPVPEVYFVNHDPNHVVGSPFVLMERVVGGRLFDVWRVLDVKDKLSIVGQIAEVLAQLAELRFDSVGSLKDGGTVGPLIHTTGEANTLGDQPFTTTIDYLCAYLDEHNPDRTEAARAYYPAIKKGLQKFLDNNQKNPTLHAPYRLIHADFESQNILVAREDGALRISGIIDWDWSHTGLLYHLCEYPPDICDRDDEPENFVVNKALRKHFVSTLVKHFPRSSPDREQIKQCFREKNYAMNGLYRIFMHCTWDPDVEADLVEGYLKGLRGEGPEYERRAYGGVMDWQPDSEPESEED